MDAYMIAAMIAWTASQPFPAMPPEVFLLIALLAFSLLSVLTIFGKLFGSKSGKVEPKSKVESLEEKKRPLRK